MAEVTPAEAEAESRYEVRPYRPADADDVRSLYATVWGNEYSTEWLAQRYEASPYLDGPAMEVAAVDGEVVGARPFVPLPVGAGDATRLCLYMLDLMVHPDHRRRGLFTRMTASLLDRHADGDADFTLNLGNEKSAPGYRKLGFTAVGTGLDKHVRLQRPGRLVTDRLGRPLGPTTGRVADRLAGGYHTLSRVRRPDAAGHRVERREGVAADLLADLAGDGPDALHVRRERPLYRWLAGHPGVAYHTYVARAGDDPVAALLTRRYRGATAPNLWVVDAVPVDDPGKREAYAALLSAVLAANRDCPLVCVTGLALHERLLPPSLLAKFGFLSTANPLVGRVAHNDDTAFVSPLDGDDVAVGGYDPRDPDDWQVRIR